MSGEPFHRCTHTAMSPQGDIYVSDGYGNSRVHKYAPNGTSRIGGDHYRNSRKISVLCYPHRHPARFFEIEKELKFL
jgi:NHL repeat